MTHLNTNCKQKNITASFHLPMLGAPGIALRELRHAGQAEGKGWSLRCLGLGLLRLAWQLSAVF